MIDKLYSTFISWLRGLIEDDPIPLEIKTLAFYINNHNEIGFSGTELSEIYAVDKFFYEPLEAQYFFNSNLYKNIFKEDINFNLDILEKLLTKLKRDDYFKKFNLYCGELFKKAKKIN